MTESVLEDRPGGTQRRRGRALTVLLVLFGIVTALAAISNLAGSSRIAANLPNAPAWASGGILVMGLLGVLAVVGLVAIWRWHRWGAYLYASVAVAAFALNMLILGGAIPFIGLLGGATILFLVSRQWSEFE